MRPTSSVLAAFTPTGKLRASIILRSPILAYASDDGHTRPCPGPDVVVESDRRERAPVMQEGVVPEQALAEPVAVPVPDGDLMQMVVGLPQRRRLAARHGVFSVAVLELDGLQKQALDVSAELGGPQLQVFHLDCVDQVDAKVAVHLLVAQDILVLFGSTGHLVLAPSTRI